MLLLHAIISRARNKPFVWFIPSKVEKKLVLMPQSRPSILRSNMQIKEEKL